jgi:HEAT repeat protein
LIKTLDFQDDENVRFEAAAALGDIGDASCVGPLIKALEDTPRVKEVAVRSLGKIGDPSAVPILIDVIKDENWEIRSAAAKSLGEIGDPRATAPLIEALEDESESGQWYITQALTKITGETFNNNIAGWQTWLRQK